MSAITSNLVIPPGAATYHGLYDWHNRIFEKLGWMVLMKEKKMRKDKRAVYVNEINKFIEKATGKLNQVSDNDSKTDIAILINNVQLLNANIMKIVGVDNSDVKKVAGMTGGARKKSSRKKTSRKTSKK